MRDSKARREALAYEGEIRIVPIVEGEPQVDEDKIVEFLKLKNDEKLFVNPKKNRIEIKKLRKS